MKITTKLSTLGLLIILFFYSCNSSNTKRNESLLLLKGQYNLSISNESRFVLITVPLGSCAGCVNHLLGKAKLNINNHSIQFIFFSQGSNLLNFKRFFNDQLLDSAKNIHLDEKSEVIKLNLADSYYPIIHYIEPVNEIIKSENLEGLQLSNLDSNIMEFLERQ